MKEERTEKAKRKKYRHANLKWRRCIGTNGGRYVHDKNKIVIHWTTQSQSTSPHELVITTRQNRKKLVYCSYTCLHEWHVEKPREIRRRLHANNVQLNHHVLTTKISWSPFHSLRCLRLQVKMKTCRHLSTAITSLDNKKKIDAMRMLECQHIIVADQSNM